MHGYLRFIAIAFITAGLFVSCTPHLTKQAAKGPRTYVRRTDINTGGFQRSYRVHVPAGYDGSNRLPMVVVVHGAFDTAEGMEKVTGFSRLADRENFIALYPNGIGILGFLQHWNAGHCCGKAAADGIDDVGFIASAIADVSEFLAIDDRRIYMVGFSNGGMLVHRFAAEKGHLLAAAAALSASIGGRASAASNAWRIPQPVAPLPLLMMHGMDDNDIPFVGGRSEHRGGDRVYWSVMDSARFWSEANGCSQPPAYSSGATKTVEKLTWCACQGDATVLLYKLHAWGHVWPGPYFTGDLAADAPLHNFDAAEIIWTFFTRHTRR